MHPPLLSSSKTLPSPQSKSVLVSSRETTSGTYRKKLVGNDSRGCGGCQVPRWTLASWGPRGGRAVASSPRAGGDQLPRCHQVGEAPLLGPALLFRCPGEDGTASPSWSVTHWQIHVFPLQRRAGWSWCPPARSVCWAHLKWR